MVPFSSVGLGPYNCTLVSLDHEYNVKLVSVCSVYIIFMNKELKQI